jgi:hypothetical protein
MEDTGNTGRVDGIVLTNKGTMSSLFHFEKGNDASWVNIVAMPNMEQTY